MLVNSHLCNKTPKAKESSSLSIKLPPKGKKRWTKLVLKINKYIKM